MVRTTTKQWNPQQSNLHTMINLSYQASQHMSLQVRSLRKLWRQAALLQNPSRPRNLLLIMKKRVSHQHHTWNRICKHLKLKWIRKRRQDAQSSSPTNRGAHTFFHRKQFKSQTRFPGHRKLTSLLGMPATHRIWKIFKRCTRPAQVACKAT